MNRICLPVVKTLFIAILTAALSAQAAEQKPAAKPDPAKGEMLYNMGDTARNVIACITCHGPAGNASLPENPKLSAQHGAYIHKQLVNFQTGERHNPIMEPIAKGMTEEDIRNVVAYLAKSSKPSPGAARNADTVELGRKIFRGGIAERSVPACAACHSANGAGIPAQFPRLAGQHQAYTEAQLLAFRSGARKNSEQMTQIVKRMSEEEIKAVADYVAGLK